MRCPRCGEDKRIDTQWSLPTDTEFYYHCLKCGTIFNENLVLFKNEEKIKRAMKEFKVGDVVRLKSGGPAMTVRGILKVSNTNNDTGCDWFEGGALHREWLDPNTLVKCEPVKKEESTPSGLYP